MKSVAEIKKIFKKLHRFLLVFSVIALVLAFLFLVFPVQVKNLIGIIGGAALVVLGILFAVYHFKKKNDISLFSAALFSAVFFFLSGLALVISRNDLPTVLPFIVGCFLFAFAIVMAQEGLNLFYLEFAYWWIVVLLGASTFFLAFLCFVKWDRLIQSLFKVLGFELLFAGLAGLGIALVSNRLSTRIMKIAEEYAEKKKKESAGKADESFDDETFAEPEKEDEDEEELMKRFAPKEEEKEEKEEKEEEKVETLEESVSRDDFLEASRQAAKERDEAAEERKNKRRDFMNKAKDVLPKIPTERFKEAEDVSVNKDQPGSTWRDKPEKESKPDFDAEGSEERIIMPEENRYVDEKSKNVFEL